MDFFFEWRDTFEDCLNLPDRAYGFPRASLSENCSLLGTDNREFTQTRRRRQRERYQKM